MKLSTNKKCRYVICGTILLCIFVLVGLIGYRFLLHEKVQNNRISALEGEISFLKAEESLPSMEWDDDNFNYLAIGNSITLHDKTSYWWNECGMAATTLENDYVHQLSQLLKEQVQDNVVPFAYNFYAWEVQSNDRNETLSLMDGLLSDKIDLVTIQLSENAVDLATFESDYEEMIRYIQSRATKAKIIVIGDFWDENQKDLMKREACENCGVDFVSLDSIKDQEKYMCGSGTAVMDENGEKHIVEHDGVARHPNDEGMKKIAEKVFDSFRK